MPGNCCRAGWILPSHEINFPKSLYQEVKLIPWFKTTWHSDICLLLKKEPPEQAAHSVKRCLQAGLWWVVSVQNACICLPEDLRSNQSIRRRQNVCRSAVMLLLHDWAEVSLNQCRISSGGCLLEFLLYLSYREHFWDKKPLFTYLCLVNCCVNFFC